ncbi:MAG: hypothetical protein R2826_01490 [Thermoleophilia bacterium]
MPVSLLIGLDVGWSERRRTCGVAVQGARLEVAGAVTYGDVCAIALFKRDVVRVLTPVVERALCDGRRVLVVADAIVGPHPIPSSVRRVDTECSRAGFFGRAQSYPATQNTGQLLSMTLHEILDDLSAGVNTCWIPWIGDGALPSQGLIVMETNPTTSMAVAFSMADHGSLPTRSAPRRLSDGTLVRAKSDWYWRSGAGELCAEMLATPAVRNEYDHERVAGLWCLALAREVEASGGAALIGDEHGAYLVGSVDPSWVADVQRVGIRWGEIQLVPRSLAAPDSTPKHLVPVPALHTPLPAMSALTGEGPDDDALRGDMVRVHFTDVGGLTRKANGWLDTVDMPCRLRLRGKTTLDVTVTPFAPPNHRSQFRVIPSIGQVLRAWGGPKTLSISEDLLVLGQVL